MDGVVASHAPLSERDLSELRRLSRVFGSIAGLDAEDALSFERGLIERAIREPQETAQMVREGQASYRIASRLQPDSPLPGVLHIEAGSGPAAEPLWLFSRVEKLVRRADPGDRLTVVITGLDRNLVGPGKRWSSRKRDTLNNLRERLETLIASVSTATNLTIVFA